MSQVAVVVVVDVDVVVIVIVTVDISEAIIDAGTRGRSQGDLVVDYRRLGTWGLIIINIIA